MQFIFGDRDLNYELIYTDGTAQEAERLRALVPEYAGAGESLSSLGFITYGERSESAIFYIISRDTSTERQGTYLHAFSREQGASYYSSGQLYSDIFMNFISQQQLDDAREGRAEKVDLSYNNDLLMSSDQNPPLERGVLSQVAALLYQKRAVAIAIPDDRYSDDTVRLAVKQIFDTLTPSLRKICTYASAAPDADVMIRILPASMAGECGGTVIFRDGMDTAVSDESNITALARMLCSADNFRWRGAFFINYETLCVGDDGEYDIGEAERLYLAMAGDDMCLLEQIVDCFLERHPAERKEELTKFAEKLTELYANERELARRFEYKDAYLLDPALCLEDNRALIYRLMLYSDNGVRYIRQILADACERVVFSQHNFNELVETVKRVRAEVQSEEHDRIAAFFYRSIALPVYENTLLVRCRNFAKIRNQTVEKVDAILSERGPIEPSERDELKRRMIADALVTIAQYGDSARNFSLSDYIDEYIEQRLTRHNEEHMSGAIDGERRYPSETVIGKLAEIDRALADGADIIGMTPQFEQAFNFQKEYGFVTDMLMCAYIIRAYNEGKTDDVRFFADAHFDDEGLEMLSNRIREYDPMLAHRFALDTFRSYDRALNRLISYAVIESEEIDRLGAQLYKHGETMLCTSLLRVVSSSEQKRNKTVSTVSSVIKKTAKKSQSRALLEAIVYTCKKCKVKR